MHKIIGRLLIYNFKYIIKYKILVNKIISINEIEVVEAIYGSNVGAFKVKIVWNTLSRILKN